MTTPKKPNVAKPAARAPDEMFLYERTTRSYQAQHRCRVALRQRGTELAVILTPDIATQAGIKVGGTVNVWFNPTKLTIKIKSIADGAFKVREQSGESRFSYPFLLVPVGANRPIDCKFTQQTKTVTCEHLVEDGGLTLVLPASVQLTVNKG